MRDDYKLNSERTMCWRVACLCGKLHTLVKKDFSRNCLCWVVSLVENVVARGTSDARSQFNHACIPRPLKESTVHSLPIKHDNLCEATYYYSVAANLRKDTRQVSLRHYPVFKLPGSRLGIFRRTQAAQPSQPY
jgi:hypothetical protein